MFLPIYKSTWSWRSLPLGTKVVKPFKLAFIILHKIVNLTFINTYYIYCHLFHCCFQAIEVIISAVKRELDKTALRRKMLFLCMRTWITTNVCNHRSFYCLPLLPFETMNYFWSTMLDVEISKLPSLERLAESSEEMYWNKMVYCLKGKRSYKNRRNCTPLNTIGSYYPNFNPFWMHLKIEE